MSAGPHTEDPTTRGVLTPVLYQVLSPCCGRRCYAEWWELEMARAQHGGVLKRRCGSILDTPGWRRPKDPREGCGKMFEVDVDEVGTVSR